MHAARFPRFKRNWALYKFGKNCRLLYNVSKTRGKSVMGFPLIFLKFG